MPRPNLLKIDDVMLKAGSWAAIAWLLGSIVGVVVALDAEEGLARTVGFSLVLASAPIGLWIAGFGLRQREKRAWSLHRLIDDHVEISATDLLRNSDFTEATLSRAVRDLNNSGVAFLVWDRNAGLVQDGRLRSGRILVEDCGACGAKVSITVRIGDIASARCPYCQDFLGAERLMEEKAQLIDELDTDPEIMSARNKMPTDFSVGIFILLTLVFWPFGITYAFWKWRANQTSD